ncbi:MAG: hypothetical protein RIS64_1232 [Bacteroidota bacterium]|jgi:uncharacterized repeat protein (TIGR01451 family)
MLFHFSKLSLGNRSNRCYNAPFGLNPKTIIQSLFNILFLFILCNNNIFSQVSLQKIPQVRSALPGASVIYDIFYSTPDLGALHNYTNVKIVDTLPTWMVWITSTGGGGFNAGVYNAANRTVTWTAATLSDGATGALSLEVQFTNAAPPNALYLNHIDLYDNGTARAGTTALSVQVNENGVTFAKTLFSGGTVGEDCVYKLVTTNNGYASQVTNYIITDSLPANAQFMAATNSAGVAVAGATVNGSNVLTFPAVTLAPGASLTYYVRMRYPTLYYSAGSVVKNKGLGNGLFGGNPLQLKDSATHTLTARTCALANTTGSDAGTWYVNDTFSTKKYNFSLGNTGTSALTNIILNDTLPAEFRATGVKFGYDNSATPTEPLTVRYQLNGTNTWLLFPGSPFTAGQTITNLAATLGLSPTDYMTAIRYEWDSLAPGTSFLAANFYVEGKILSPMRDGNPIVTPLQLCNRTSLQYKDCSDIDQTKLNSVCNTLDAGVTSYTVDKRTNSTEWRVTQTDATYDFVVRNTGTLPLDSLVITDTLPVMFQLTKINLTNVIAQAAKPVAIWYQKNGLNTWYVWTGSPFSTTAALNVSTLGITAPNYVSAVRFNLGIIPVGANYNNKEILLTGTIVNPQNDGTTLVLPASVDNFASFRSGTQSQQDIVTTSVVRPYAQPIFAKSSTPNPAGRLDTITYTILVGNQLNTPLNDFTLLDPLSSDLDYVAGSATVVCQSGNCYQTAPYTLTTATVADYNGTGGTLLKFAFDYGANDGLPLKTTAQGLKITYKAVVKQATPANLNIVNDVFFEYKGDPNMLYRYTCLGTRVDTFDINGINGTTDTLCKAATVSNLAVPFIPAAPLFSKSSTPATVRPGDTLTYTVLAYNNSVKLLNDFELIDALSPNLQYIANSAVATCQSGNCYQLAPYVFTATAIPNYGGTDTTLLRFAFDYGINDGLPQKTSAQGIKITFKAMLKRTVPSGTVVKNDVMFQYNGNPAMQYTYTCAAKPVDVTDMNQNGATNDSLCRAATTQFTSSAALPATPTFSKTSTPATVRPSDTLFYTIKVGNTSAPLLNDFAMIDFLNANLTYVLGSEVVTCQTGNCYNTNPFVFTPTIIPNYRGTGKTLLRYHFDFGANDGLPLKAIANGLKITFKTVVKAGVTAGTSIVNDMFFQYTGDALMPYSFTCTASPTDVDDINQNGLTNDALCKAGTVSNPVVRSASLASQKYVKGSLDSNYMVNGHTMPGGLANYKLQVWNSGNVPVKKLKIVDVLPFVNDRKVLYNFQRVNPGASEWRPILLSALSGSASNRLGAAVPYTVKYSKDTVPCLANMSADNAFPMPNQTGCQLGNFTTTPPNPISDVQSLIMDFGSTFILNPQDTLTIYWQMQAPLSAQVNKLAWNAFAYVADYADGVAGGLQPSEPPPVSIIIDPAYLGSIGNYAWVDENENGLQDEPDSLGINNLRIELWTIGADGIIGTADDTLRQFKITQTLNGKPGYYRFTELYSDNYYVKFPTMSIFGNRVLNLRPPSMVLGADNDSDASEGTGFSPVIPININGTGIQKDNMTIDVGFKALPPPPPGCPPLICFPTMVTKN